MQILRQLRVFKAHKWGNCWARDYPRTGRMQLECTARSVPQSQWLRWPPTQQHLVLVAQPVVPDSFSSQRAVQILMRAGNPSEI